MPRASFLNSACTVGSGSLLCRDWYLCWDRPNYTVQRFGRCTRTLSPGLHILVPVMDVIGHKMNMMEQVIDIPSQDVITRDNALVRVDGVNFVQVLNAAKAAYEIDGLEHAIW